ncbi:MAG: Uncharacterized protein XE05_1914 [Thermotogales bacterium 46_20]|nr:MAG: Uncharacterized protein XE05_1914 [Thermotogales bacterium 46_20]
MKNRNRGFSLVELLIVLAVIAALIATITPVALNAIKKAKATQVAQNLKTLASALENAAYVNGADASGLKKPDGGYFTATDDIKLLARDVDKDLYGIWYAEVDDGKFKVSVFTKEAVDFTTSQGVLKDLTKTTPSTYLAGKTPTKLGLNSDSPFSFGYNFEFIVY